MKSRGAIGLIIGIRPKLEGAAVHWHIDQQQRREQESGQSSMQPEVMVLTLVLNMLWPSDLDLILYCILTDAIPLTKFTPIFLT